MNNKEFLNIAKAQGTVEVTDAFLNAWEDSLEEKTYQCGSWVIGRQGAFEHNDEFNAFIHWAGSGDWFVQRNDEFYGDFKTLESAKKYIEKREESTR